MRTILLLILLLVVLWYADQVEYRHVVNYAAFSGQQYKIEYDLGMSRLQWAERDLDKMITDMRVRRVCE